MAVVFRRPAGTALSRLPGSARATDRIAGGFRPPPVSPPQSPSGALGASAPRRRTRRAGAVRADPHVPGSAERGVRPGSACVSRRHGRRIGSSGPCRRWTCCRLVVSPPRHRISRGGRAAVHGCCWRTSTAIPAGGSVCCSTATNRRVVPGTSMRPIDNRRRVARRHWMCPHRTDLARTTSTRRFARIWTAGTRGHRVVCGRRWAAGVRGDARGSVGCFRGVPPTAPAAFWSPRGRHARRPIRGWRTAFCRPR